MTDTERLAQLERSVADVGLSSLVCTARYAYGRTVLRLCNALLEQQLLL